MNHDEKLHVLHGVCEKVVRTMEQASRAEILDSTAVQRIQLMAKTLKDLSIAEAMWQEQEDGYSGRGYAMDREMGDYSGRRMRSARTGRFYSGDGNSMDGNSMDGGGNSMDGSNYRSYAGDENQDMIRQMKQMLSQMERQQGGM